jgi:hypothetical protein
MMQRKEARKILGFKKKESQIYLNAIQVRALRRASVPRYSTCEGKPQAKAQPAQAAASLDSAPQNRKKPAADLGADQRIATAGETVPIVFGKRTSGIGGVWLQPSLLKTGTELFVSSFLYVISQGEMVGIPQLGRTFVGTRNIRFLSDQPIQLAHEYSTAAALAAAPTTCPIVGGGLWCDFNTDSFLAPFIKAEAGATFNLILHTAGYFGLRIRTEGIGDTTNSVILAENNPIVYLNSGTGEDITQAVYDFLEITLPSPAVENLIFNAVVNPSTSTPGLGDIVDLTDIIGGEPVGTILDAIAEVGYFDDTGLAAAVGLEPGQFVTQQVTVTSVDNQVNLDNPSSTGTLFGLRQEIVSTPFEDPDDVPTADNSSFADITFLTVTASLSDLDDDGGTFPASKQLSIFYGQGVKVDLYSGGLVGTSYAKGSSNQLVDLLMYMFTLYKRADGANTADIASPIFTGNMTAIAAFCDEYKLHFNGVVDEAINIIDFAVTMAPFFLLSFLSVGGQYRLEPILPLTTGNEIDLTPITPVETFNEDNILPGTFSKSFRQAEDRRPFVAVMLYRESRPSQISVQKTVEVAFSNTPIDAPQEQFDMTDFCTDSNHAAIYGKYQLARRMHITHSISFDTALVLTDMKPTQIIKVERQRVTSKGDNRLEVDFYQITSIAFNNDGTSAVEAEHFPLNNSGVARISNTVINGNFRVLS